MRSRSIEKESKKSKKEKKDKKDKKKKDNKDDKLIVDAQEKFNEIKKMMDKDEKK